MASFLFCGIFEIGLLRYYTAAAFCFMQVSFIDLSVPAPYGGNQIRRSCGTSLDFKPPA